jgi:hypothetical protein
MQTIEQIVADHASRGGGEFVTGGRFVVASYSVRDGKRGQFAALTLSDPSGRVDANCFDDALVVALRDAGAIDCQLRVSTFNNRISVVIQTAQVAELTFDEMLRFAGLDPEVHARRIATIQGWLDDCKGTVYGDVLDAIFTPETWNEFVQAPAAVKMHHAEPGGLVRHLVEVGSGGLGLLESTGEAYDRPYFLAGVMLHDIGKLDTYTLPPTIAWTAHGQLAEHQIWSTFRLAKACAQVGVPRSIEAKLVHIIEQAHGAYKHAEWQDALGPEVKALAAADFFSSRLGETRREKESRELLERVLEEDARGGSDRPALSVPNALPADAEAPGAGLF